MRIYLWGVVWAMVVMGGVQASVVVTGAGSYTTSLPTHQAKPSNRPIYDQQTDPWTVLDTAQPVVPKVSSAFVASGKPPATHEFWSSVIWEFTRGGVLPNGTSLNVAYAPFSHTLHYYPFGAKIKNNGLALLYSAHASLTPVRNGLALLPNSTDPAWTAYSFDFREDETGKTDVNIAFANLTATRSLVEAYGDWHTKVVLQDALDAQKKVYITMAQGVPFTYFEAEGLNTITLTFFGGTRAWYEKEGMFVISREDMRTHYAFFAPPGTTWNFSFSNDVLRHVTSVTMTLPTGNTFFSVAVLPDKIDELLMTPTAFQDGGFNFTAGMSLSDVPRYKAGTNDAIGTAVFFQKTFGEFGGYFHSLYGESGYYTGPGANARPISEALITVLTDFRNRAFSFVTGTQSAYGVDTQASKVVTSYTVSTTQKISGPGLVSTTYMGMLPAHYKNIPNFTSTGYTYRTPRGEMRLVSAGTVQTEVPFYGLIPYFPNVVPSASQAALLTYLDLVTDNANVQAPMTLVGPGVTDTYHSGKDLARLAELVPIALQQGRTVQANTYLTLIKSALEDWLSANDATADQPIPPNTSAENQHLYAKRYFYYDNTWKTVIGYPASFESDRELNDHHFHYGYLIKAAATVARYDKNWAQNWAPMVNLMIKDTANWDRQNTQFPYLRYFDPYLGFSIANGPVAADSGMNQESSSEALNFSSALILWGAETNDATIRDLGVYLYATEIQAVQQYWFDVDGDVFPNNVWYLDTINGAWALKSFNNPALGIVWGAKGDYGTWFGGVPHFVHGINFLPVTTASLYLGLRQDNLQANLDFIPWMNDVYVLGDAPTAFKNKRKIWSDIIWSAEALFSPSSASANFVADAAYPWENAPGDFATMTEPPVRGEKGDSKARTYHWIQSLGALGTPDGAVRANYPFYSVFKNSGNERSYVVYNPHATPKTVTFTNGQTMQVPAYATRVMGPNGLNKTEYHGAQAPAGVPAFFYFE